MIAFEQPWLLALALPWLVFVVFLWRFQTRSLAWIEGAVGPRFRAALTMHSARSIRMHVGLWALLGLLLVVASARPVVRGEGTAQATRGRMALVIDASASMAATDAIQQGPKIVTEASRLTAAKALAGGLVASLPDWRYSLISFSGVATVHLPMTDDAYTMAEALRVLEVHSHYQRSGSSLAAALDAVLPQADAESDDLHVVLIGDGEAPFPEDITAPLAALTALGVPVHTLGVGSEEGQGRVIWDFRDVFAGVPKEERRVLREYHTRRVDDVFQRVAEATGGTFHVGAGWVPKALAEILRASPSRPGPVTLDAARTDLAPLLLLAALVGFLIDALWIGHHRRRPSLAFDLDRLGTRRSVAGLVAVLMVTQLRCGGFEPALQQAHHANERGIEADVAEQWPGAQRHYRRAKSHGARAHVPTHNLGRSLALAGRHAEAHDALQAALTLDPTLLEAQFNDGVALHAWGEAERDPAGCELARTRDLWQRARLRFDAVVQHDEGALGDQAFANLEALDGSLATLDALIASPPPGCPPPPPSPLSSSSSSPPSSDTPPPPPSSDPPPPGDAPPTPPGDVPPPPPSSGPGNPPPSSPGEAPPEPRPLNESERAEVEAALVRMAGQRLEAGKYHRRTLPEQFPRSLWENPDPEIWW